MYVLVPRMPIVRRWGRWALGDAFPRSPRLQGTRSGPKVQGTSLLPRADLACNEAATGPPSRCVHLPVFLSPSSRVPFGALCSREPAWAFLCLVRCPPSASAPASATPVQTCQVPANVATGWSRFLAFLVSRRG